MSVRVRGNGSRNPMLTPKKISTFRATTSTTMRRYLGRRFSSGSSNIESSRPRTNRLPTQTLELIEQLFVTWFELADDGSRRAALSYVFATEAEERAALLAIVPLYYDEMFFDELTPTRDLVELALLAHAKWRFWLGGQAEAS